MADNREMTGEFLNVFFEKKSIYTRGIEEISSVWTPKILHSMQFGITKKIGVCLRKLSLNCKEWISRSFGTFDTASEE